MNLLGEVVISFTKTYKEMRNFFSGCGLTKGLVTYHLCFDHHPHRTPAQAGVAPCTCFVFPLSEVGTQFCCGLLIILEQPLSFNHSQNVCCPSIQFYFETLIYIYIYTHTHYVYTKIHTVYT